MKRLELLGLGLLGLALACSDPPAEAPEVATVAAPAVAPPSTRQRLDARTPAQFAEAWITVIKNLDPDSRDRALGALHESWQGRRFRWRALALPGLCVEPKRTCSVNVWPYDLPGRKALGGTMPVVEFTPAGWTRLKAGCKNRRRCVVVFEGRLNALTADFEKALRFEFQEGEVIETREPHPDDKWYRPIPRSPKPSLVPPILSGGTSVDLRPPKTF